MRIFRDLSVVAVGGFIGYHTRELTAPMKAYKQIRHTPRLNEQTPVNPQTLQDVQDFDNIIKAKNLVEPVEMIKIGKEVLKDSFVFSSLLKNLQGLNFYHIMLPREFYDKLSDETQHIKLEKNDQEKLYVFFRGNKKVQGFEDVLHGGFTSTILDNTLAGLAFLISDFNPATPQYLNTKFKRPLKTEEVYMLETEIEAVNGRKILLKGFIYDKDMTLCAETQGQFTKINWYQQYLEKLQEDFYGLFS